jgi:hypothetical protein
MSGVDLSTFNVTELEAMEKALTRIEADLSSEGDTGGETMTKAEAIQKLRKEFGSDKACTELLGTLVGQIEAISTDDVPEGLDGQYTQLLTQTSSLGKLQGELAAQKKALEDEKKQAKMSVDQHVEQLAGKTASLEKQVQELTAEKAKMAEEHAKKFVAGELERLEAGGLPADVMNEIKPNATQGPAQTILEFRDPEGKPAPMTALQWVLNVATALKPFVEEPEPSDTVVVSQAQELTQEQIKQRVDGYVGMKKREGLRGKDLKDAATGYAAELTGQAQ